MNTTGSFLSICSEKVKCRVDNVFSATLNICNYRFHNQHFKEALLLEGVNQFSVRCVVGVSSSTETYLPVMVKELDLIYPSKGDKFSVLGRIKNIQGNKSYLVEVIIFNNENYQIGHADIVVSQVPNVIKDMNCMSLEYDEYVGADKKLFTIKESVVGSSFILNEEHPLFLEHFPKYPILPGSLVLDLLLRVADKDITCMKYISRILVSNFKFIQQITPGKCFRVVSGAFSTYSILDDDNTKYFIGKLDYV